MKQTGLRLILFIAAIGLWAYIFYTVYSSVTKKEHGTEVSPTSLSKDETAFIDSSLQSEVLLLDYPDPFLKRTGTDKTTQGPVATSMETFLNKPQPMNEQSIKIPDLIFQGCIRSNQNKKSWAIITYLGQTKTMQVNDTMAYCKLLRIWNDSVQFLLGKTHFVKRK